MTVGSRLNGLRGKKSLADLGDKLGVSAQQLSRIENDLSAPSLELTLKICEHFGVTMDWLIRGIEPENVVEEPRSDYITISKDELIALQRIALGKTEKELAQLKNAD